MKPYKYLIPVLLLVMACENAAKDSYTISIESEKLHNGLRSYIKELDGRGKEVVIDSAIAMNNQLEFTGSVDFPKVGFLSIDGMMGSLMLFVENNTMRIELDTLNIGKSKIKGSQLNEDLAAFNKEYIELRMSLDGPTRAYRDASRRRDSVAVDSITEVMTELGLKALYFPLEYAKVRPDNFLSLFIVDSQIGSNAQLNYEDYNAAFTALDTSLTNSVLGEKVQKKLELERIKFEKSKVTAIGAKAPEFRAATPSGEQLALSEVYTKGKITIVDFWAAWCGPCRRENPRLVRTYNKYHDKGLEIIGVSLDGNRNQKDPKAAWIKAIEDDKLDWYHVSNLQYFGPIAQQYNVNAIPAMFILDSEGKIVGKNLRGMALENKVAELLAD